MSYDPRYVDEAVQLGVEVAIESCARLQPQDKDTYRAILLPMRPPNTVVNNADPVVRSDAFQTANDAVQDAFAKYKALPVPPTVQQIVSAKDEEIARLKAEVEALAESKATAKKK